MDDVRLRVTNNHLDICITVLTEPWLHENIPELAVAPFTAQTAQLTPVRQEQEVCAFTDCFLDLEFLTLKCKPSSLPREFSPVFITAVYVTPVPCGVRNINSHPTSTDPSFPDQLNTFFIHCEDNPSFHRSDPDTHSPELSGIIQHQLQ